jgi:hypothetical protein
LRFGFLSDYCRRLHDCTLSRADAMKNSSLGLIIDVRLNHDSDKKTNFRDTKSLEKEELAAKDKLCSHLVENSSQRTVRVSYNKYQAGKIATQPPPPRRFLTRKNDTIKWEDMIDKGNHLDEI